MPRITMLLASAAVLAVCSQTSSAGTKMQMKGQAFPPPAFILFCAREKRLCSTSGGAKVVQLTAARKAQLASVNSSVNRRIAERSDLSTTGHADEWGVPKDRGDCEDFAILKKSELMKLGWPRSALLLTVARVGGAGHTVLTVRTSDGDVVLDNRTSSIKDWSRTPYRYFARQSQSSGKVWERISSAEQVN